MRSQFFALAAATATIVYALPSFDKRDVATWDGNGNIKLTFELLIHPDRIQLTTLVSKDTVKIGDIKIDDMFDDLAGACHETGQCDTNDITLDGWWQADGLNGYMGPIVVTMGPSGTYPTWIRNGLVDTLRAAVKAGAKTVAYQCEVPAFLGIDFQDPNEANAAPPAIGVDVQMDFVDSNVCADMMTGLSAVAGAVSGVAGGIFSLLSLTCG